MFLVWNESKHFPSNRRLSPYRFFTFVNRVIPCAIHIFLSFAMVVVLSPAAPVITREPLVDVRPSDGEANAHRNCCPRKFSAFSSSASLCSLEELERRESFRGDGGVESRLLGLARRSDELCHDHIDDRVTVRTDQQTTAQSVATIIDALRDAV